MTTNIDRVAETIMKSIVMMDERLALDIARALHDKGMLMPDGMTIEYGHWCRYPNGESEYWGSPLEDQKRIVRNMRTAGLEAEIIARHVSPARFITSTKEPS